MATGQLPTLTFTFKGKNPMERTAMKTTRNRWVVRAPMLMMLTMFFAACDKNETVVTGGDEAYVPLISNLWIDAADNTHSFLFSSYRSDVTHGAFRGNENSPVFGNDLCLIGNYANRTLTFNVARDTGVVTFSGKFLTDTLIDLGSIKIYRN